MAAVMLRKSQAAAEATIGLRGCPIIGSLQKSLSGRQFTGKNLPRPMTASAGRIFTCKLWAGEIFLGGSYNGETFLWPAIF